METVTGYVTGISGNLANVKFESAVRKVVAYISLTEASEEVRLFVLIIANMCQHEMSMVSRLAILCDFTGADER